MLTGSRPVGVRDMPPCFTCPSFRNTPRDKCWDLCNMLFRWNKARILRAARETTSELMLREMEQTVHKHVKEFESAFEASGAGVLSEREEYSDEQIDEMADEIFADLEKESEGE